MIHLLTAQLCDGRLPISCSRFPSEKAVKETGFDFIPYLALSTSSSDFGFSLQVHHAQARDCRDYRDGEELRSQPGDDAQGFTPYYICFLHSFPRSVDCVQRPELNWVCPLSAPPFF